MYNKNDFKSGDRVQLNDVDLIRRSSHSLEGTVIGPDANDHFRGCVIVKWDSEDKHRHVHPSNLTFV